MILTLNLNPIALRKAKIVYLSAIGLKKRFGSEVIKNAMLISAEHEIFPAHKC